jgi:tRNA (guanine-N7-)-methyltransferase
MVSSEQLPNLSVDGEIVPQNYVEPVDLPSIYGRVAPLEVDLGCGDGEFLAALAATNGKHDFLGTERQRGRVKRTESKIARRSLGNMRVLWIETSYAVQYLLPTESVAVFHLMFPDPWPKRRHWRRRLVNEHFLQSIRRALIPTGLFRVVTDHSDYFAEIERLVQAYPGFARVNGESQPFAMSTFEKRFRDQGIDVHCLVLRKVSPVTNALISE